MLTLQISPIDAAKNERLFLYLCYHLCSTIDFDLLRKIAQIPYIVCVVGGYITCPVNIQYNTAKLSDSWHGFNFMISCILYKCISFYTNFLTYDYFIYDHCCKCCSFFISYLYKNTEINIPFSVNKS